MKKILFLLFFTIASYCQAVFDEGIQLTNTESTTATKAPISSVHNPVTLGTANGLSLSTQQLSLGLASSGVTGALSGTDWNNFNGKFNTPTGLTTNYLPKWNGSGFVDSSWQEFAGGRLSNTGSDDLTNKLQVNGSGRFRGGLSTNNSKLVLRDDSIENHSTDSDDASIAFNVFGFNKGSTRFRNVRIFDGKGNPFVFFSGQNKEMIIAGTISASPATTANQVVVKSQLDAVAASSGTYTPTLSNITNISALNLSSAVYTIIGNIVTVRIEGSYDPIAANTITQFSATLPVIMSGVSQNSLGSGATGSLDYFPIVVSKKTTSLVNAYLKSGTDISLQPFAITFSYRK